MNINMHGGASMDVADAVFGTSSKQIGLAPEVNHGMPSL